MDAAKVSAVTEWPTLLVSNKQLQIFLGFANFYEKFIHNFSSIASPLHAFNIQQSEVCKGQ